MFISAALADGNVIGLEDPGEMCKLSLHARYSKWRGISRLSLNLSGFNCILH